MATSLAHVVLPDRLPELTKRLDLARILWDYRKEIDQHGYRTKPSAPPRRPDRIRDRRLDDPGIEFEVTIPPM